MNAALIGFSNTIALQVLHHPSRDGIVSNIDQLVINVFSNGAFGVVSKVN